MTNSSPIHNPNEEKLHHLVDQWISHGSWRHDFESYRKRMYHIEEYQDGNLRLIHHAAPSLKGLMILDLGCGHGGLSVNMAQQGGSVISCDLNRICCEMALLRGNRHNLQLTPVEGSAHQLPFPNQSFDLVTCCDVLEHVGDPEQTLREVRRVLRLDGVCVLNIHHRFPTRDPHFRMNFINWLPVLFAEWLVKKKGRDPNDEDTMTTNCGQRLSDLHYYTCGAFRRLCQKVDLLCEILPPGLLDDKPLKLKHRIRPFQNQYKVILRVPK